jgi:hypothetical protein
MKYNEMILLPINLQLFASNDEDYIETDDIETEDIESDEVEELEDKSYIENEDIQPITQPKDKVTHALIKQKQANKELKQRLEYFEQKEREAEQQNKRKQVAEKYVEKGYDESDAFEEADKHLESESIKQTVKKLEFMTENSDILARYPEAKKNINELIKIQKSTGWDLEKICRVEYDSTNNYDNKIKSEQEAQLRKTKRVSMPTGGQTPIQSVKLDPEDERAYSFYAKKNPGVSRKQYQERLNNNNQNIPHDRWE